MNVLSKIFSSGATELIKGVGGVLDNLTTSKEEKLEAERKVKELISSYEIEMEKNITERWKMDMQSDSWLSKNIRPLVLIFLVISTVLFHRVSLLVGFSHDLFWSLHRSFTLSVVVSLVLKHHTSVFSVKLRCINFIRSS